MADEKAVASSALWQAIDTLIAVKIGLHCDPDLAPDAMILSAQRARSACQTIDAAITLLRELAPPVRLPEASSPPPRP